MRADRLLQLADFLDKLPEEKFDFGTIAKQSGKPMLEALAAGHVKCGTVGCAIGWLPAVFPDQFKWVRSAFNDELTVLTKETDELNFDAAAEFFGIGYSQADYLFMPGYEDDGYSGLADEAKATEVAAHIRKFVETYS
jgi:hypothetical protein